MELDDGELAGDKDIPDLTARTAKELLTKENLNPLIEAFLAGLAGEKENVQTELGNDGVRPYTTQSKEIEKEDAHTLPTLKLSKAG